MNYGTFFKISLFLMIIATIGICVLKPNMHKKLLVYDSDYKIVEQAPQTVVETDLPTVSQKTETKKVRTEQTEVKYTDKDVQTPKTTVVKLQKTNKYKPVTENKKNTVKTENKILTQKQEEIEWNKWRSNLQNQIMRDVKLPIMPQGTIFKFEFDVDKYGKISNVQTWSQTSQYTPYAIQYIAPVIRSYRGHEILNFPNGSNRTKTHVTGGWKIAANVKYSTPKDYNDTETIKK